MKGSITKRSGQKLPALQAESNFWAPQEAQSDNPEVVGSSPSSATKSDTAVDTIVSIAVSLFYCQNPYNIAIHKNKRCIWELVIPSCNAFYCLLS